MNSAAQIESLPQEEVARIFHSALVATRTGETQADVAGELMKLASSPAFRAILGSVRELAAATGATEAQAAESIIRTFRRIDVIWQEYLIQEGADRLRQLQGS